MGLSRLERFLAERIECDDCGRVMRPEFAWLRNGRRLCGSCEDKAKRWR